MMSIMEDANWLGQAILQWIADSPTSWQIDSEIGDLRDDSLGDTPALISYQRYEVALEAPWLHAHLGVELSDRQCEELIAMDNPGNVARLAELGRHAAAVQVDPTHFCPAFDI